MAKKKVAPVEDLGSVEEVVKLVVMSYSRAEVIITHKAVDNCVIVVPENQLGEYKEYNPDLEYVTHPNLKGYAAQFFWVLNKFKNVMVLDDDFNEFKRLYTEVEDKHPTVEPSLAYQIIQATAQTAKNVGAKLFGFNTVVNPLGYNPLQPLRLTGLVMGATGFLDGVEVLVPDDAVGNIDYFWSGLNAYFNRICFCDSRYCFAGRAATFTMPGGMADQRTLDSEKNDLLLLRKWFGSAIEMKHSYKNTPFGREKAHAYEHTLKVPW